MTIDLAPVAAPAVRRTRVTSRPVGLVADIVNVLVRELQPVLRVQPGRRLVQEEQPRRVHQPDRDVEPAPLAAEGATWAFGDGTSVERAGTTVRTRAAGAANRVARFVTDLDVAGAPVARVEVASATLDDVFLELTGRSLRESNDTPDQPEIDESKGAAA